MVIAVSPFGAGMESRTVREPGGRVTNVSHLARDLPVLGPKVPHSRDTPVTPINSQANWDGWSPCSGSKTLKEKRSQKRKGTGASRENTGNPCVAREYLKLTVSPGTGDT